MAKILIADDNSQITMILSRYAAKEGLEPLIAHDGLEALEIFAREQEQIAIVLLDVMMPKLDGFGVCQQLRQQSMVPIIMITAKTEDYDRIMGLDMGADDYVVKPFAPLEVMARIRAVLRRIKLQSELEEKQNILRYGSLEVNISSYKVAIGGQSVELTKKEVELLWTLAKNKNKNFSRDNLLDSIWGYDYEGDSRTVDSHIKRLRAKLDKFDHPDWEVKTIWGVGYGFEGRL